MHSIITKKYWLKPKNQINFKVPLRHDSQEVVCGPPRFPMSLGKKILMGGGATFLMILLPILGLLSVPSWSVKHANLGKANLPPPEEEGEAAGEPAK